MTIKSINYLSREHLDTYWDQVKPFLEAGLFYSEGELDSSQLRLLVAQGAVHVIIAIDTETDLCVGALAFEIMQYPNYRCANIISYGGDHLFSTTDDICHLREELRRAGIHKIQGWCKPAQARLFKQQFGAETPYQMIRIDLQGV